MQVTIEKDCHQISWGFSNINKVDVRFPEDQTNHESNDAYLTLEGIIQEARYDGAFPNVDLQYFILPTGVKENIIPKKCRHAEYIGGQDSCPLAPDTQDRHVMCRFLLPNFAPFAEMYKSYFYFLWQSYGCGKKNAFYGRHCLSIESERR